MTEQIKGVAQKAAEHTDKIHRGADSAVIATFVIEILKAGLVVAAPTISVYLVLYIITLVRS